MDEEDRLKSLRKAGGATLGQAEGKAPYQAFSLSREPLRHLEIRLRFPEPAECPLYAMVSNIRYEWRWGSAIGIAFGGKMAVEITGRELHELMQALKECRVEWIAEFDPRKHELPSDEASPLVEGIEIVVHRPDEMSFSRQLH